MASSLMDPPKWNQENKDLDLWVQRKEWKISTANVQGLKGVHSYFLFAFNNIMNNLPSSLCGQMT